MDRDTAVSLIESRVGFRSDLTDYIVQEMQAAQTYLEEHSDYLPDFLLTERATITMTADEERVALPDEFLREQEDYLPILYDTDGTTRLARLSKEDLYDLEEEYHDDSTDQPKHFALHGPYFRLFPIPDAAYKLKLYFYKAASPLTTNFENAWLKHCPDWLIGETGFRVALFLQLPKMVEIFKAVRDTAKESYRVADEARRHANRRYRMGAPR